MADGSEEAVGRVLTPEEVLALVPQQEPFRFIDEIHELDHEHIVASYVFSEDADFYHRKECCAYG